MTDIIKLNVQNTIATYLKTLYMSIVVFFSYYLTSIYY